ncbi:hypothetical protein Bca101_059648 [Brassica carinata]
MKETNVNAKFIADLFGVYKTERVEGTMVKWLRENISMLILGRYMKNIEETKLNLISGGVTVNLHMFGAFMEDRVCHNVES